LIDFRLATAHRVPELIKYKKPSCR